GGNTEVWYGRFDGPDGLREDGCCSLADRSSGSEHSGACSYAAADGSVGQSSGAVPQTAVGGAWTDWSRQEAGDWTDRCCHPAKPDPSTVGKPCSRTVWTDHCG